MFSNSTCYSFCSELIADWYSVPCISTSWTLLKWCGTHLTAILWIFNKTSLQIWSTVDPRVCMCSADSFRVKRLSSCIVQLCPLTCLCEWKWNDHDDEYQHFLTISTLQLFDTVGHSYPLLNIVLCISDFLQYIRSFQGIGIAVWWKRIFNIEIGITGHELYNESVEQWFPKCVLWIPRDPRPVSRGSIDMFQ
jgi:hypothetical protein